MRSNWRDCEAWKAQGFKFNTTNNEVCKLYDAAITQYVGMYDDQLFNGIEGTVNKMLETDSDFIMGHVFKIGSVYVHQPYKIEKFKDDLNKLNAYKNKHINEIASFELRHIDALNHVSKGNLIKACQEWENVLIEYPNDILALKFLYDAYFHLGIYARERKDVVASVLPHWKSNIPLYEYVYGMYAFALGEINFFKEAEEYARKSLFINPYDSWAVHSLAHAQDYENRVDDGIKFLKETENYWCKSFVNCHNYWHLALHYIEKGDFDEVINLYDTHLFPIAKQTETPFTIIDACSLMYRLKLEKLNNSFNVDLKERWLALSEFCYKNIDTYSYGLTNAHLIMGIDGMYDEEANTKFFNYKDTFINSLNKDENEPIKYYQLLEETIGSPIYQAIVHFDNSEFSQVVDLLYPIRYQWQKLGGSNAQVDLIHQILTNAAVRSPIEFHKKLGIKLLNERKAMKPNSKVNERIISSFQSYHNHV